MTELLFETLAMPGLLWVVAIATVAGVVYGFAGFGSALVFMPVAVRLMPVEMAIAAFGICGLASFVSVVPDAWPQSDRKSVTLMILCGCLTLPIGVAILGHSDTTTMRWAVLAVTALTLVSLLAGWRYAARPAPATRAGVALAAGLVGGATGLVGPIMVLFQLGGQDSVARSRANAAVFLTTMSLLTAPAIALQGMLSAQAVMLGLLLLVPYGVAGRIGRALFDPARQRLYRGVAYTLIAVAITLGLPIYD